MTMNRQITANCVLPTARLFWTTLIIVTCLWCIFTKCESINGNVSITPSTYIFVVYGEKQGIFCTGSGENYTSDDLVFTRAGRPLSPDLQHKVNSTTIAFFEGSKMHSTYTYYCRNKNPNLWQKATVHVTVAAPPAKVGDFECVWNNLEYINCSWTTPNLFYHTDYTLSLLNDNVTVEPCKAGMVEGTLTRYCFWSANPKDTPYSASENPLHIRLKSTYSNYTNIELFEIDHYSMVKLKPPQNVMVKQIRCHGATINWTATDKIDNLPHGIELKIEYKTANVDDLSYFLRLDTDDLPTFNRTHAVDLINLKYAHVQYHVKLSIKPKRAREEFWSDYTDVDFYTASESPSRAPIISVGGFTEIPWQNHRVVYIYWKIIKEYEKAGKNFSYVIHVDQNSTIQYFKTDLGYLRIENASLDAIEVNIWSANEIGLSRESSHLFIPPKVEIEPFEVKSFTKFSYDNGTYELSWVGLDNIDNYTLFMCEFGNTKTCYDDVLEYTVLDSSSTNYVVTLPNYVYCQFAIAANKGTETSGMIWTNNCDFSVNNFNFNEITFEFTTEVSETSVVLEWSMNCLIKDGIITGYQITYCPVSEYKIMCDNAVAKTIASKNNYVTISGLQPYKTYQCNMALNTSIGLTSIQSSVQFRTLEDAPTNPRNVDITDVKYDSLVISWDPPLHFNGQQENIRYILNDSNKSNVYNAMHDINNLRQHLMLNGLSATTNYSLTVIACNVEIDSCSNSTDPISVITRIGPPDKLNVTLTSEHFLTWTPPKVPNGFYYYYQIKINRDKKSEIINITNLMEKNFNVVSCTGKEENYVYQVRAVVIDYDYVSGGILESNSTKLSGAWSDPKVVFCKSDENLLFVFIFMGALGVMCVTFCFTKCKEKLRQRADIGISKELLDRYYATIAEYTVGETRKDNSHAGTPSLIYDECDKKETDIYKKRNPEKSLSAPEVTTGDVALIETKSNSSTRKPDNMGTKLIVPSVNHYYEDNICEKPRSIDHSSLPDLAINSQIIQVSRSIHALKAKNKPLHANLEEAQKLPWGHIKSFSKYIPFTKTLPDKNPSFEKSNENFFLKYAITKPNINNTKSCSQQDGKPYVLISTDPYNKENTRQITDSTRIQTDPVPDALYSRSKSEVNSKSMIDFSKTKAKGVKDYVRLDFDTPASTKMQDSVYGERSDNYPEDIKFQQSSLESLPGSKTDTTLMMPASKGYVIINNQQTNKENDEQKSGRSSSEYEPYQSRQYNTEESRNK